MSTIQRNDRAEKSTSQVPFVYPNGVPATLKYPSIPAWGLLKSASDDFPDRIACRYYKQKLTYRELWEESLSAAAVLKDLGVQSGDCVGLLLPNLPEYIIALNAIWLAGGVAVAISPLLVTEEVSDLLAATGCRIVVSLDMLAPRLEGDYRPDQTLMVTLTLDDFDLVEINRRCFAIRSPWHRNLSKWLIAVGLERSREGDSITIAKAVVESRIGRMRASRASRRRQRLGPEVRERAVGSTACRSDLFISSSMSQPAV